MSKRISQREARRLRKRVQVLEQADELRRRVWSSEYPGGVQIECRKWESDHPVPTAIRTARKLAHAVICLEDGNGEVRFVALKVVVK